MDRAVIGRTTAAVIFVGIVAACAIGFVRELKNLGDLMGDSGYCRFDREHHIVDGYRGRISTNLGALNHGLRACARAHDGRLPAIVDAAGVDKELFPKYVYKDKYLVNPNSRQPLKPNPMLSGRTLASIRQPENVVAFFEADPPKTFPPVYYVTLDGNVHNVSAAQWGLVQAASTAAIHSTFTPPLKSGI